METAETKEQSCNNEKHKLEAEIYKLEERVKQLTEDLQVEKQRVVDQQFSTQRLLLRLRRQEEQLVRHRPDELAGQSPQQKNRRTGDQAVRTPGQTEPSAYRPRNRVRDQEGAPREQAEQVVSRQDHEKPSREASEAKIAGQRDQTGLSRGQTSSDKDVNLPQKRRSDVNQPSPRQQVVDMVQTHEEYSRQSTGDSEQHSVSEPDSQLGLTINSSNLTTARTLYRRRKPHRRQSNYSDDDGISPQREIRQSLHRQSDDVRDDGEGDVVKRDVRSARRDANDDDVGTQDQEPATVM